MYSWIKIPFVLDFPGDSRGKEPVCQCSSTRDAMICGSEMSPGGGHGNPLQYSCQENPMDRGAWWATIHSVTKSWTNQSDLAHMHPSFHLCGQADLRKKTEPSASGHNEVIWMHHLPSMDNCRAGQKLSENLKNKLSENFIHIGQQETRDTLTLEKREARWSLWATWIQFMNDCVNGAHQCPRVEKERWIFVEADTI